ncbi:hypothetical protein L873DRAFT_30632 [Choiromyces venosus 120613-1]|uniref:Uncharacterized protein n=1 Tax=Choiromyces venosus 120613-1 TaxID=1336337 RepID=A0A3N4K9S9_9PEZI|nr:hypothetical protein L873DRAFT_30632 [Choiromyces venosus 120613-1]
MYWKFTEYGSFLYFLYSGLNCIQGLGGELLVFMSFFFFFSMVFFSFAKNADLLFFSFSRAVCGCLWVRLYKRITLPDIDNFRRYHTSTILASKVMSMFAFCTRNAQL